MTARSFFIPDSDSGSPVNSDSVGSARPITVSNRDISRFQSLTSAPVKGLAKGFVDLARLGTALLDPTRAIKKYTDPLFERAEEKIEENIPTHPEFAEKTLERFGKMAPLSATAGIGGLAAAGAGALGGQVAEELGGGPITQTIAESIPAFIPSLGRKLIASSADQKRILGVGRKYGFTEEEIAPLFPETGKKRFFGKFAFAGESAQGPLKKTRQAIQNLYDTLTSSPEAAQMLNPQALNKFTQDINRLGLKMPNNVRSQLAGDAADFIAAAQKNGGVTGSELINFYHDVSSRYNLGKSQLELFKGPIKEAIGTLSPTLAHDFETANRMYQKSAQIGRILRPSEYEHLISLGEAYEMGASIATLDMGRIQRLLGLVGFRKFSEKMLTSPRLQNIIEKTQIAVQNNQLPLIKKLGDLLIHELKDEEDHKE